MMPKNEFNMNQNGTGATSVELKHIKRKGFPTDKMQSIRMMMQF
jgi:hypothetical protein